MASSGLSRTGADVATLVLFSGLPGCGKTTLARRLASERHMPLFAKDRVQRVVRDSIPGTHPLAGYHLILDLADEQLALGVSVIADAVFPRAGFRADAAGIAARYGAAFRPVQCVCTDERVWKGRLDGREQYVPGWEPVGWAEVERLRPEYEAWDVPVLVLDAVQPVATNLARLLAYVDDGD